MRFGLFFFGAGAADSEYEGLLAAAEFAEHHDFAFISIPERHFHQFGGAFPNPLLTLAALAVRTKTIQLRTGSLILPLHNTIRVAEDLAVIDCLSRGRVAISVGMGWNVNDFAIDPEVFVTRRERLWVQLEELLTIWRAREIHATIPGSQQSTLSLWPTPHQVALPVWLTISSRRGGFVEAGKRGLNVLTHLENQDLDSLAANVNDYRKGRSQAGLDPVGGIITLMQHAYVSDNQEDLDRSRQALISYIGVSLSLEAVAVQHGGRLSGGAPVEPRFLAIPERRAELAELAAERYIGGASLIGNFDSCASRVRELEAVGVSEVACLIDFIDKESMLKALPNLGRLRSLCDSPVRTRNFWSASDPFPPSDSL